MLNLSIRAKAPIAELSPIGFVSGFCLDTRVDVHVYVDWDFEDPKGRPVDEVGATRHEVRRRVEWLEAELDVAGTPRT